MAVWRPEGGVTGRVRCMERNTAKYSEIQQKSIQDAIQQSCPYSRLPDHRSLMAQAITLAELERRLQIRLASPIPAAYQRHNYEPNLVRGHEAAIRLVDAGNYVCLCCPAPLHNNGMFKTGEAFCNVLRHVSARQHLVCAAQWVKAQRTQHLMRRLRLTLFARVAGCVLLWRARAADRAYAPGGLGFKEAQADFQAHTSVCM